MWILSFLPASFLLEIINTMFGIGLIGTIIFLMFGSKISLNWSSAWLAVFIGLLASSVYLKGGYSSELAWREKVNTLSAQIKEAEAKSEAATVIIEEKVVSQIKEVKIKGDKIVKYVDREVVKYDHSCVIPKEVVNAHNAAALNVPVEELK